MDIGIAEDGAHLMLVMWHQYGIEAVVDITKQQKEQVFDILATGRDSFGSWLNTTVTHMTLRARANDQRNYEIYSIWVDESIGEEDILSAFDENPQNMANLVRERGTEIFKNGRGSQKQVIF